MKKINGLTILQLRKQGYKIKQATLNHTMGIDNNYKPVSHCYMIINHITFKKIRPENKPYIIKGI